MKKINSRDVARLAGCSQSTVSRVMNSDPRISRETRIRVIDAARKLKYDMKTSADRWGIGVIAGFEPEDVNGYYANILAAVSREIFQRGLRMEVLWRNDLAGNRIHACRGVIDLYQTPAEELVAHFSIPVVRINGVPHENDNIWNVGSISGIHIAVQYLLKLGHRNIRYISLEGLHAEETKPTKRWQGFLQEMTRAGIQNPETMAIFCSEADAVSELVRSIDAARQEGCTALITVNALHTLKVHAALHRLNLQIPQDISVIDWEYTGVSEYLDPPRTTVGVDYARMAQEAVDLLENILDGSGPVGNRRVPSRLILRESCGQCR